jgi:mono/diheme cytochrome c family protein
MKRIQLVLFSLATFSVVISLGSCTKKEANAGSEAAAPAAAKPNDADAVKRGEYLVSVVGSCNDCHTPWKMGEHGPEPDMTRMLSGSPEGMVLKAPKLEMPWMAAGSATMTAWAGPWGISYTHNLTPDSTGLGTWDETTFKLALRNGKHIGNGRPIMPPMPWQTIGKMTDDDLHAVWMYLRSIPPVKNTPPEYQPPVGAPTAMADHK